MDRWNGNAGRGNMQIRRQHLVEPKKRQGSSISPWSGSADCIRLNCCDKRNAEPRHFQFAVDTKIIAAKSASAATATRRIGSPAIAMPLCLQLP